MFYIVRLVNYENRVKTVQVLRAMFGLSLEGAQVAVTSLPFQLVSGASKQRAAAIEASMAAVGAVTETVLDNTPPTPVQRNHEYTDYDAPFYRQLFYNHMKRYDSDLIDIYNDRVANGDDPFDDDHIKDRYMYFLAGVATAVEARTA